ncbi:MAG: PH domain-containing protein [Acidobacteriia bacterium]|nr:PH domain-containing protein [Terriglobia bacterium]
MTHKAKIDWWIAAALILGVVAPFAGDHLWITIPLFLAVGICGYPQYYQTRDAGLVIQAGLIRRFIPYEAITFIGPTCEGGFSLAFSPDHVTIRCGSGSALLAPADCAAFMADMARRMPQLTWRGQDLVRAYV